MILPPLRPYKNFGYTYCQGEQADAKPSANPHDFVSRRYFWPAFTCRTAAVSCATYVRAQVLFRQRRIRQQKCRSSPRGSIQPANHNHDLTPRYHAQALATAGKASPIYDNGPIDGNSYAWTINFGFVVSDKLHGRRCRQCYWNDFRVLALPGRRAGVGERFP